MALHPHIDYFLSTMQSLCPTILDEHLIEFSQELYVKEFKAKEIIFDFNSHHAHLTFIISGLARSFYTNEKGDEITTWFSGEDQFITDYPAFLSGERSRQCFKTIEPTTLVYLPKTAMEKGYKNFPTTQEYGRLMAEYILGIQQQRIEGFLFKSAKERYEELLDSPLNLINRVSQRQLASFIGIERQSLTRIRKQLIIKTDT